MSKELSVIVIPARMASSRFPGKPMVEIAGTSLLERVWRIAKAVGSADAVVIATDNQEIRQHAQSFSADVVMTSKQCKTGTDRVAEAVQQLEQDYSIIFNLQGDAVLTPPWIIGSVIKLLKSNPLYQLATPAVILQGQQKLDFIATKKTGSSSGTSVVFSKSKRALYFSKTLLPYARGKAEQTIYRHIGLYGYRKQCLLQLTALEQTPLEQTEQLEQLRALENDIDIYVELVDYQGRTHGSVDNPSDIAVVEAIIQQEGELVL